jgi:hypothetical protein
MRRRLAVIDCGRYQMAQPPSSRTDAIKAFYRVRAVEKPPEPDGTREVWHQAAPGVELLGVVNPDGTLAQQELTLFEDHVHWYRRGGLRTGKFRDPSRHDSPSGDGIIFDPTPSKERLERMAGLLAAYDGSDKHLLHMRDLISAGAKGETWNDARIVSGLKGEQSGTHAPSPDTPKQSILGALLSALNRKP